MEADEGATLALIQLALLVATGLTLAVRRPDPTRTASVVLPEAQLTLTLPVAWLNVTAWNDTSVVALLFFLPAAGLVLSGQTHDYANLVLVALSAEAFPTGRRADVLIHRFVLLPLGLLRLVNATHIHDAVIYCLAVWQLVYGQALRRL
jgi:hypothetical protein